jgi:c-di-GMP-binding flagellar brake protein YcgR
MRQRRRFPRTKVDRPALVRLLETEPDRRPEEVLAQARVLGAGGCMVESPKSLGYLSLADVQIALEKKVVRADSRVVWEREDRSGRHRVGVEFLRLSPDDRATIESVVGRDGRQR